jgi:hypothetical protein
MYKRSSLIARGYVTSWWYMTIISVGKIFCMILNEVQFDDNFDAV